MAPRPSWVSMTTITATNISSAVRQYGSYVLRPNIPCELPLSFIAEWGQPSELRFDFSRIRDQLDTRDDDGNLIFEWRSLLSAVEGYGRHAIWLIRALQRNGARPRIRDVGWVDRMFVPNDIDDLRRQDFFKDATRIGVSYTLGYDPQLSNHNCPVKIALTQFESDRLPRKHASNINQCDHCVVTSSFQVDVFRRSGVQVPISVMRPGIDTDEFSFVQRPMDGTFKVLMLGALTGRKNPLAGVRIFQHASRGNPDWRLTIKTRPNTQGTHEIMGIIQGDKRITLAIRDDHPSRIGHWYASHDCLLWPSKGEGLGLPPLEAMATGMECVVAEHSGMLDYVDSDICYPIKVAGMESAEGKGCFSSDYVGRYGDVGGWWLIDEDHGAKQLEKCFHRWRDGKGKGVKAALAVRAKHSIDQSARDLISVIEGYE